VFVASIPKLYRPSLSGQAILSALTWQTSWWWGS
jgi:hypothetical protein